MASLSEDSCEVALSHGRRTISIPRLEPTLSDRAHALVHEEHNSDQEVVMAALVVSVLPASGTTEEGRIAIFPGAATTNIYAANTPFWVGYGFTADPDSELDESTTRFELDVDGDRALMRTHVESDRGLAVHTTNVSEFPQGLPPGWHEFSGRWYDAGRLVLSSRTTIQFVEA
jgi:hypothetical protein